MEACTMFGLVPFTTSKNTDKDNGFMSLFDAFNEPFFTNTFAPVQQAVKSFKVDVKDNGSAYELTAELPGVKKENISLDYDNGYLTISTKVEKTVGGDAKDGKDAKAAEGKDAKSEGKYVRRERYTGEMSRSFYIDGIDEKNTKAAYKDGILTVTMPKAKEEEASTKINIA